MKRKNPRGVSDTVSHTAVSVSVSLERANVCDTALYVRLQLER